ncbi:MAG TPA: permease prefix domain 1-containing protein [Micromonosporaceae bacterium]|nr:permease prefix domain 1-containing protein [Micromonosporaceae bacterium]
MTVKTGSDEDLEGQIAEWRGYVRRRREVHDADAEELEDHLRSMVSDLTGAGLRPDEAFLVAVKRMGSLDELSREFAREHSDRLWKQLVLTGGPAAPTTAGSRREWLVMAGCAVAAAAAIKIPAAFGYDFDDDGFFYLRNFSLLALAPLAAYFAWRRRVRPGVVGVLALLFAVAAVAVNAYPLAEDAQTTLLAALHLPLALWLVVGVAYAAGDWRSDRRRMDFIRFTGEWFVYFVLMALGGGVLAGITAGTFAAIGLDASMFIEEWLIPCGAMAAVVVSAWLVEAKQGVIENMAPVLTRVFTPLFTGVLLAFLVAVAWTTNVIDVERDVLILFDLLLVIVLGLLLYAISARDPVAPPTLFDRLQLALVLSALAIDVLVLVAITGRITEWGSSPNKIAALGENLILLANLAWSAWLFTAFLRRRVPFAHLERWQTGYLAVYALWAWAVVLAFPPMFDFA